MMFTRGKATPPAARTTERLHVRAVRPNFEVREEEPAPPRFVRRSPVPEPEPFIRLPTKAQLMARR